MRRLLLRHGIRVDIHELGSRGIATTSLKGMDAVFPSGQPAAKLVRDRQQRTSVKSSCRVASAAVRERPGQPVAIVLMTDGESNSGTGYGEFLRRHRRLGAAAAAVWDAWGRQWLVRWLLTAAAWAWLCGYGAPNLVRWSRSRQGGDRGRVRGMCFCLHRKRVMDIFESGGFTEALRQEVADRTNVSAGTGDRAPAKGKVSRERVTTYVREETPIKVIRLLMDTMRKEDRLVDADLTTGVLQPNRAVAARLRERRREDIALSDVMSEFGWVTARFTASRPEGGDIVLRAGHGDGRPAHIRVTCAVRDVREQFRDEEYSDGIEFQARCLGKVRSWNRQARELTLDAVAVFR
ncbi:hypothetical protein [Streptomyces sp. H51]|uniref:hypothetical protein n=1 Tax=Streptomyces sp. H51 TaxID=3111770 RepID=UPI002D784634|nr:hypothetical protein [Streptomyces sp. H51]